MVVYNDKWLCATIGSCQTACTVCTVGTAAAVVAVAVVATVAVAVAVAAAVAGGQYLPLLLLRPFLLRVLPLAPAPAPSPYSLLADTPRSVIHSTGTTV